MRVHQEIAAHDSARQLTGTRDPVSFTARLQKCDSGATPRLSFPVLEVIHGHIRNVLGNF
jgi:hypothetical protein